MRRLLVLIFLLISWPAMACVQSVVSTATDIVLCNVGVCKTVVYSDLTRPSRKQQEEELRQIFQDFLDVRLLRVSEDLEDDEIRATDPQRGDFFWSDENGVANATELENPYITSRACVITDVTWTGTQFSLTIERTN